MVRSTAHLKAVNHSIPSVYRSCHKPLQIWKSDIKHFIIYFQFLTILSILTYFKGFMESKSIYLGFQAWGTHSQC